MFSTEVTSAESPLIPSKCPATIGSTHWKLHHQPDLVKYLYDHKPELDKKCFENNPVRINAFWGSLNAVTMGCAPGELASLDVIHGLFLFAMSRDLNPMAERYKKTTEFLPGVFRQEANLIEQLVSCDNFSRCIHVFNEFFRTERNEDKNRGNHQHTHQHHDQRQNGPCENNLVGNHQHTHQHHGQRQNGPCENNLVGNYQHTNQHRGDGGHRSGHNGNNSVPQTPFYDGLDQQSKQVIDREIKNFIGLLFKPGLSTRKVDRPSTILTDLFNGVATINLSQAEAHGLVFYPLASLIHDSFHFHDVRDTHRSGLTMLIKQRINEQIKTRGKAITPSLDEIVSESYEHVHTEYVTFLGRLSLFREQYKDDRKILTALFEIFHEGDLRRHGQDIWLHIGNVQRFFSECAMRVVERSNDQDSEYGSEDLFETDLESCRSIFTESEIRAKALEKIMRENRNLTGGFSIVIKQTDTQILAHYTHPSMSGTRMMVLSSTLRHKLDNAYDLWRLLGGTECGLGNPKDITSREDAKEFLKKIQEKRKEAFQHLTSFPQATSMDAWRVRGLQMQTPKFEQPSV